MAQYKLVSQVKDSISGILQGLNLNNVKNLNTALERVARQLATKLDIPESILRQTITLYDGVTDYLAPTNMFSTDIVDFRPQGVIRDEINFVLKQPLEQFDREKGWNSPEYKVSVEYNPLSSPGTTILRVSSSIPQPKIELDPCTATTGWVAAGTASGLVLDSTVFWQSPGALRCALTTGTGTLTKTISSVDITNYPNVGVVFIPYYANAANITSIQIKIGSSASNYYTVTSTTNYFGSSFISGAFDLVSFNLAGATTVGTPDQTKITYAQITIVASGTISNFYVGDFWIALPSPHILLYNSSAIFLPTGATTPLNTISSNNDTVVLNDAALSIYELEASVEIAQQQGGSLASNMIATLDQKLNGIRGYRGVLIQPGLLDLYRADNPSQKARTVGSWYDD